MSSAGVPPRARVQPRRSASAGECGANRTVTMWVSVAASISSPTGEGITV
jgi:hypothetical protein